MVPICIAALQGHVEVVKYLCHHGAKFIDVSDNHGRTPVYAATQRGHTSIIKELYSLGADITIPDDIGRTPLSLIIRSFHL